MKKFMTKAVSNIVSYSLLCLLAFGSVTGAKALVSITVAAYWVIILLGLFVGMLILLLSYAIDLVKDEAAKQKVIDAVREAVKRKSKFMRFVDWSCVAAIAVLLAYSGWVFTGVCYVLVALIVKFCLSMARDNVTTLNDKEVGRDGTIKC
ncbi:hypothetical protein [Citrobacter portucalensis]|uniref:hypothetical protein n=1 Tax=Citrobacter portucalensis TaxID=1639133 RepID=UPI0023B05273|nr:hypothetical protein [Citrobacter portucalensis]